MSVLKDMIIKLYSEGLKPLKIAIETGADIELVRKTVAAAVRSGKIETKNYDDALTPFFEIANRLGVSEDGARKIHNKALLKIKKYMEDNPEYRGSLRELLEEDQQTAVDAVFDYSSSY